MVIEEPHEKALLTSPIGRFIDSRSYFQILTFAFLVIILASVLLCMAPAGQGLISSQSGKPVAAAGSSLYFSIVTFTTVGYGDLVPVGLGRVVSIVLAVSGLASVALLIGKVASERQYSMLLLLHTSDCQRRIAAFAQQVQAISTSLRQAIAGQGMQNLDACSREAMGLVNAISNYVVFHLNQSRLAEFGNHTSLKSLCSEVRSLQLVCSDLFKQPSVSSVTCQRCIVLVERLEGLVRLISTHDRNTGIKKKRGSQARLTKFPGLLEMTRETEMLKTWSRSHVTEWSIKRVFEAVPKHPVSTWLPNEYKEIAARLQFSNNLTKKCIDELIRRKLLSIK